MAKQCPICSSELPYDTARFCPECGTSLQPPAEGISHREQYQLASHWDGKTSLAGFFLAGADLTSAHLRGADLHGATLIRAKLSRADLSGADLTGADLQWADLHWADLEGVILRDANLQGAFLWVSRMQHANLTGANLERASLRDARLQQARLVWANLQWADLSWANLEGADLGSANLRGADLSAANLRGAYLGVVTMEAGESVRVASQQEHDPAEVRLAQADILQKAILPDGSYYDGRLNLAGDLERARNAGIDPDDAQAMAAFYGVSPAEYERGQQWAAAHLEHLRRSGE